MVNELSGLLMISAAIFTVIFLILVFIWVLKPAPRNRVRKDVKGDLKKIKDQINGDD